MVERIGQKSARLRKTYFREWREFRGLTQEQLAELLGTGKSAVSKMERGENKYNQYSLEAWADALNCEPSDLISRPPSQTDIRQLFESAPSGIKKIVEAILKTG
jgi:transcriptional regulator with XRE-family HTH domain